MDKNTNIQPLSLSYEPSSISFPLNEDSFKDFIVSLLGQPESIEAYVEGPFEIDFDGFELLSNAIDNRIDNQNLSSLIEFKSTLFYEDGSTMKFNGMESFLENKSNMHIVCNGFSFTWSYLVKFNNKEFSEKQVISIYSLDLNANRGVVAPI